MVRRFLKVSSRLDRPTYVNELTDVRLPLKDVKKILEELILVYGPDVKLVSDAGANNVEFYLEK